MRSASRPGVDRRVVFAGGSDQQLRLAHAAGCQAHSPDIPVSSISVNASQFPFKDTDGSTAIWLSPAPVGLATISIDGAVETHPGEEKKK